MKSLPLQTIDMIHVEGSLSHESHFFVISTNGDMVTIPQIKILMASTTQEVVLVREL
jgi:hypothetical protein